MKAPDEIEMKLAKSFHRLDKMADEDMFSELPFPSYSMKMLLGPMFAVRVRVILLKEGDKIRFATCLLIFSPDHQKSKDIRKVLQQYE